MKLLLSVLLTFCFLSVYTLAQNNTVTGNDISTIRANIEKINQEIDKAQLTGDVNTMDSYFTDDAYYLPSYQPIIKGKSGVIESDKKDYSNGLKYNTVDTKTIDVFGNNDLVCEIGTYHVNLIPPNQTQAIDAHGKYMNIWQKQSDGTWKVKASTWNSDTRPGQLAGAREQQNNNRDKNNDKDNDNDNK